MRASSQGEIIQFRIPGDPKYVSTIRRAVQSVARNMGFPEETVLDIEMSVAEALANAVAHGSPKRNGSAVVVICRASDDSLTIDVRDEGSGFEPGGADETCEAWGEHGRGLRMIYRLMDKVRVCRTPRGSRIRMVKNKHLPERTQRAA